MDARNDVVFDHQPLRGALVSELTPSTDPRPEESSRAPIAHPSVSPRMAPGEAARLVGDEVASVLEAAQSAAAQIRTRAHDVVTDARRKILECQRVLDELSTRLNELSVSPDTRSPTDTRATAILPSSLSSDRMAP